MVWLAALAAVLGRFPSAMWPLRPDEAGFLLVARSWHPSADSVYGHYFVDRPPSVIALMQLTEWIGGPYFHRVVGALGCGLLVLAAAAAAREIAHQFEVTGPGAVRRVAGWTAVVTAALVVNAEIDPIAAKGELLGIPLVTAASWLALRATRLQSWPSAFAGGLLAVLAMGMKQSLVGGLVLGGTVLIAAVVTRRLDLASFGRLALAATAGAAIPVAGTIAWALAAGVRLETLFYTIVGFRSDASEVLVTQNTSEGATARVGTLVLVLVGTGMVLVAVWFLARLPRLLRRSPVGTSGVALLLAVDAVALVLSGSFWLPYLFGLVPGLALATACVLAGDQREDRVALPRATRVVVGVVTLVSVLSLVGFVGWWAQGRTPIEHETGRAIAEAARPGDTLTVFGGRADIQWASGLPSPYSYLWSLPMRTLDTSYVELREVLTGTTPPTWVVEVVSPGTWTELGVRPIEHNLLRKYELVGTACDDYRVYHLNTVEDIELDVECGRDFRFVW